MPSLIIFMKKGEEIYKGGKSEELKVKTSGISKIIINFGWRIYN